MLYAEDAWRPAYCGLTRISSGFALRVSENVTLFDDRSILTTRHFHVDFVQKDSGGFFPSKGEFLGFLPFPHVVSVISPEACGRVAVEAAEAHSV